ncbi:ABC transporter permease [Kitasatospora sp. NBC_00240]|uniref:ABC transporter permease n=1 Tax=Kitasatospora sp. NBC_00240 TaxID=2903567 RepID=UPI0022527FAB|nr:ABC transporter permease [Kitasatospora sp. NBC_00240]MCX5210232.1 ABC transporter permease [Kitasatospora sp. NBC_00240]
MIPAWVYLLTASVASTAYSFDKLYPTEQARRSFGAGIAGNGSLRALYGPLHDAGTIGGLTAWRMGVLGATLAGLMSILLVVRHTRAEEEDGRLELIGAGAVGRPAPLTAALATVALADLLLAALITAALAVLGQPLAGSLALGLATGCCGLVFGAVAAVTAQLAETARAATGSASAVLGLAFVLRAAGDATDTAGPGRPGLLSPIGWAGQVRPFAADRWWILAVLLGAALALAGLAYALVARRDLGAGLIPQRPGPAVAAPSLSTHFALARRLHSGTLYGWCAGLAAAGAVFGAVAEGVASLAGDNASVADMLRRTGGSRGILDAYLGSIMGLLGMVAAGYAVQAVLRLRAEETGGRAEPVLATAVSRLAWAGGHLLFPLLGSAAVLALAGLTAGLTAGTVTGDLAGTTGRLLVAALVQLPAVWLTAAVTLLLHGLLPRWSAAGWGVLTLFVLIGWIGPVVQAAPWVLDLSPFTHLPHLPGDALAVRPLLLLTVFAAALAAAGLAGLRRRDFD